MVTKQFSGSHEEEHEEEADVMRADSLARDLEHNGLVDRTVYPTVPPRVERSLTGPSCHHRTYRNLFDPRAVDLRS